MTVYPIPITNGTVESDTTNEHGSIAEKTRIARTMLTKNSFTNR